MEFRIVLLGQVELRAGATREQLGAPKERIALAALAWDANRSIGVDTLVHRVWGESPPAKPRDALYSHICRIRKRLREFVDPRVAEVVRRGHTYTLTADPDAVDLRRYLTLLQQAQTLADADLDSACAAVDTLDEAARLWGGEPLAGLPGPWPQHLRETVAERNLAASVLRAGVALRRGRYTEAAADLQPLAEAHLTAEKLVEQLALALYGSGRTAEAARLLQRARHRLLRELGSEPGPELRRVHEGILARTPISQLLPDSLRENSGAPPPDTLPRDVTWVGRRPVLDRLLDSRSASGDDTRTGSIELLTGMPGTGKTTLAVHVAHRLHEHYPDGRLFLDMRGHAAFQPPLPPEEALSTLLRLLDSRLTDLPTELDDLVALWRTTARHRRFVAVLDDAANAEQVRPLLPGASPAMILVTSRKTFTDLPGVRPTTLDLPSKAEASALFQHFVDGNAVAAPESSELVRLVGRLPLAIQIAASRLLARPSWSTADLLERFNDANSRLPVLKSGNIDLRHTFSLSYRTLTSTQARTFRRIGLHLTPEFGPEAAAALSDLPRDATEQTLEELVTYNLIRETAPNRFRLHDLVREFTLELVKKEHGAEERTAALQRLLRHYTHSADHADRRAYPHRTRGPVPEDLHSPTTDERAEHGDAQQWFTTEGPNLLATLEYTHTHGSARDAAVLAHVLAGFLDGEGHLSTALPHLRRAVDHWSTTREHEPHAHSLLDLSSVCTQAGHYDEAIEAANAALDIALRLPHSAALAAEARHQLSISHWHTAQYHPAYAHQQRVLQYRLTTDDRRQQARSYNMLGMICLHLERHNESLHFFSLALAGFRETGDTFGEAIALNNMAEANMKSGDREQAERFYKQALRISATLGLKSRLAIIQINYAKTLRLSGNHEAALKIYEEALPVLRSSGDLRSEAIARNGIGQVLHALDRSEEALAHHTAALAAARRISANPEEIQTLRDLGSAELSTGRHGQALVHLRTSLEMARRLGETSEVTQTLEVLRALDQAREHRLAS
ncbi:tetratricopeptide repeat protein [Streptomyces sp. AJS327]|uniref:AfsR/SARP family transcriptional regulator n=1 Tax=Streptomyces sp. AJS327 TaxID=2545265 RepID=UPI0015DE31EE|nr:tetratricopeptide repeat protein [Streptomyces sp. AJS327]